MHGKDNRRIQFSLCSHKKPTNFSLWRKVCEPFVDGAAQVHSPVHIYTHLVCKLFVSSSLTIRCAPVYEVLDVLSCCRTPKLHESNNLSIYFDYIVLLWTAITDKKLRAT